MFDWGRARFAGGKPNWFIHNPKIVIVMNGDCRGVGYDNIIVGDIKFAPVL